MKAFIILPLLFISFHIHAQKASAGKPDPAAADFCRSVTDIIADAGKNFMHIKGGLADSNGAMMIFTANKGLPRASSSNIIDDGGMRYEGLIYGGSSKEELQKAYTLYKSLLDNCLIQGGYESNSYTNEDKDLASFPAISYGLHGNGSAVILSAGYSAINSLFSLTISVNK